MSGSVRHRAHDVAKHVCYAIAVLSTIVLQLSAMLHARLENIDSKHAMITVIALAILLVISFIIYKILSSYDDSDDVPKHMRRLIDKYEISLIALKICILSSWVIGLIAWWLTSADLIPVVYVAGHDFRDLVVLLSIGLEMLPMMFLVLLDDSRECDDRVQSRMSRVRKSFSRLMASVVIASCFTTMASSMVNIQSWRLLGERDGNRVVLTVKSSIPDLMSSDVSVVSVRQDAVIGETVKKWKIYDMGSVAGDDWSVEWDDGDATTAYVVIPDTASSGGSSKLRVDF